MLPRWFRIPWWREIRKNPNIPPEYRDLFERFGEVAIGTLLGGGWSSEIPELKEITGNPQITKLATDWLSEQSDRRIRQEDRVETVDCAILVFVVIGVIIDVLILFNGKAHG